MDASLSPEERLRAAGANIVPIEQFTKDPMGGAPWPLPKAIVSTLPRVRRMRGDMLPDAIRAYVFDVAERQQSPVDFAAITAMCAAAAVVGNRVRIAPKQHDDWTIVPNLWGAVIGRPSAMKSPAMQSALGALYGIQDKQREAWEQETREKHIEEALASLDAKEAKKAAEKALKGGDRETARKLLAGASADTDDDPPQPRLVVNDATVEKLGELLNENRRGLLLVRDELPGFLARMESEEYQSERAFYLECFNGDGRFTYDRIGRGTVHIENCTLSLIGGVQPSRIAPIVRGAMTGANNDGLIQRLQLAVWPDDKTDWEWVDRHSSLAAKEAYRQAFESLDADLPGSPDDPAILRFSSEAQDLFRDWMTSVHQEARAGGLPSVLESHILKMPKTIASLALLFELIEGGRFEVGKAATNRALAWASYLRSHASRLYAAGNTMAEEGAKLIVERRQQLPSEFSARAIHKKNWAGLSDREAVDAALELLTSSNYCREMQSPPTASGGRPTTLYRWNPSLEVAK